MWLWKSQGSGICPERALLAASSSCWWGRLPVGTRRRPGQLVVAWVTVTTWPLTIELVRAQDPQA